jgi:hypothetical protein
MSSILATLSLQIRSISGRVLRRSLVLYGDESGLTNAYFNGHQISTLSLSDLLVLQQSLLQFEADLASSKELIAEYISARKA